MRPGETLYSIAFALGVSEEQLRWWNLDQYPSLGTNPRDIVVGWVLITEGGAMPTPTPRPTPVPTPAPTPVPAPPVAQPGGEGGGGSDWTYAAYQTALAWRDDAFATYYSEVGSYTFELAWYSCCPPGSSPEEVAAAREEARLFYLDPAFASLGAHETWLIEHAAASCFQDAYQADRNLAASYRAWLSAWYPSGYDTPEGRARRYALDDINRDRDALFQTNWFSDCA